jgi:hypothetical protein
MADVELDVGSSMEANTNTAGGNTEVSVNIVVEPGKTEIVTGVGVVVE